MSRTVDRICADLYHRERVGITKYGTTVDREDFEVEDWLQHLYEEALDSAVYARRALDRYHETIGPIAETIDRVAGDIAKRMGAPEHSIKEMNRRLLERLREETK